MDTDAPTVQQGLPSGNLKFIHLIAGALLIGVLLLTGWAYFQKYSLNNSLAEAEAAIAEVQDTLDDMSEQKLDSVVIAQNTIQSVESSQIVWSEVLTRLLASTPIDVFYRSYSASMDGQMSVSVLTDSYDSAAQLIAVLDDENTFEDVFVSSLSKGSADAGFDVVSFGITFSVNNTN